jgi:hypothetical protein
MSDTEITVRIDDDDDDDAASERRIAAANKRGADARAEAARHRLETARLRTQAARDNVENALLTAQSEVSAAQTEYADAFERGDFDTAAKATARISEASSRRVLLANQREALARAPISSGDEFEDHLARFTEPTANWMRDHRDWVVDQRKSAKLTGAHHMALSEGLTPDTPAYFDFVEKTIGVRDGNSGRGSADHRTHVTSNGVYLTENEKKIAQDGTLVFNAGPRRGQPIGIQEMARRKSEMHKQGLYHRLA